MIPVVDEDICIGCGNCMEICSAVFQLQDEKSHVIDPDACEFVGCCEAAAENCPVEAITLEGE
ncbi:MAG: ferredoxin [Thermodesulfovibrionia bacterium]|nr:ferredoxin [Thermodesulfovibrionia bacterium]